ncbi:MAG TPA: 4-hydroxyphenylacetate decarboxylase activase [Syntrophomonadaceae bacterium]|nr:4-hydroxyphenylacetate decarboxylase activase [Syntrophomonadaceae bacterium]
MVEERKGLVFDIQGYSVHDGPGCRSLVFLSGCPLSCDWCANPEGQELKQRVLYRVSKCKYHERNCRRCISACPYEAIAESGDAEQPVNIDRNICRDCKTYECTKACIYEALNLSGKWMTVDELMAVIERDRKFWGDGGGVTFTGGEPLLQKDFLLEALKRCKASFIHTSIETSGFASTETFMEVINLLDFAFVDLKHMDPDKHMEHTGVRNELILSNIKTLAASDWPGLLVIRIPVIEGFNDSDENIRATAEFLKGCDLEIVNILPFHRLGDSKYKQLGMKYKYSESEGTPEDVLLHIQEIFLKYDIACFIGSNTPF